MILQWLSHKLDVKELKSLLPNDQHIQINDLDIITDIEQWIHYNARGRQTQGLVRSAFPFMLSPMRLANNIVNKRRFKPSSSDMNPEAYFRSKLGSWLQNLKPYENEATLQACRALALCLSNDPIILFFMRAIAQQYTVTVTTEPTLKGNSELNIYHPNYSTKRITNMPMNLIKGKL